MSKPFLKRNLSFSSYSIFLFKLGIIPHLILFPLWSIESLGAVWSFHEILYNILFIPIIILILFKRQEYITKTSDLLKYLVVSIVTFSIALFLHYFNWAFWSNSLWGADYKTYSMLKLEFHIGFFIILLGVISIFTLRKRHKKTPLPKETKLT